MVEIDEKGPVDVPCTRVELGESGGFCGCKEGRRGARVDDVPEGVEFLECYVPFTCENVRGEFTPVGGGIEVIIRGEDAKVVEIVCGTAVVAISILELTKVVQCGDLFQCQL